MPGRANWNPTQARQGGGGIEAGKYRVTAAKTQNLKSEYRPNQLNLVLTVATLDAAGHPVRDAEAQELRVSFGEKSLADFHPGFAATAEADTVDDRGDGIDAEGNTIYMLNETQFNKSCGAIVFLESLRKQGFPEAILNRTYAPDLIGLDFELATMTPKECNDKYGLRLNTKPMKDKDDPTKEVSITYKVVKTWLNPTYLGGTSTPAASASTGATNEASATTSESVDAIATRVLHIIAERKKGQTVKSPAALLGFFTNEYSKVTPKLPPTMLAVCQAKLKDEDFLITALSEIGATMTGCVTTFPA
jgi:hypothetical protein